MLSGECLNGSGIHVIGVPVRAEIPTASGKFLRGYSRDRHHPKMFEFAVAVFIGKKSER